MTPDSAYDISIPSNEYGQDFSMPEFTADTRTAPEAEIPGFFSGNIGAGVDETQALLYAGAGALGDMITYEPARKAVSEWGYKGYQENMAEAAKMPRQVEGFTSISNPWEALLWGSETTLRTLPTMVASLGTGGAGAIAARTMGGAIAKTVAANAIEKRTAAFLAQGMAENAAKAAATKSVLGSLGATTGVVGATTMMEGGGNWAQDVEAQGMENTSPMRDMLFGLASGVSEAVLGLDAGIIRKATGRAVSETAAKTFGRALAQELPKAMLAEGGQEGFQQLLSNVNAEINRTGGEPLDLGNLELKSIVESVAAGALLGGLGSPFTAMRAPKSSEAESLVNEQSPVNKVEEIRKVQETIDPFDVATKDEQQYLNTRQQKYEEFEVQTEEQYTKTVAALNKKRDQLTKTLNEFEYTTDPKNMEMKYQDPEKWETLKDKTMKDWVKVLTDQANLTTYKKEATESRRKQWEDEYKKSGKRVLSAERESIINKAKAQRAEFETSPFVFSRLNQISSDAEAFANRQVEILGNRVNTILKALGKYNELLDTDYVSDYANPTASAQIMKSAMKLQDRLKESNNQIIRIQDAAKKLIQKTAHVDKADIGTLETELTALQSMRDFSGGRATDVKAELKQTGQVLAEDTVEKQVQEANLYGAALRTEDIRKNPKVIKASELFSDNVVKSFQQGLDKDNEFTKADARVNAIMESALDATRYERELIKMSGVPQNVQDQAQASQVHQARTEEIAKPEAWFDADLVNKQMEIYEPYNKAVRAGEVQGPEITPDSAGFYPRRVNPDNARYDQTLLKMKAKDAVKAAQETKQLDTNYKSHERTVQILQSQIEAAEQSRIKQVEKETNNAITGVVYKYLNNTLTQLPALKDVTTVCTSHSDLRVPVDLHAAIVSHIQAGNVAPKGAYYKGKIYLFANAIDNKAQAAKALMHEGIGHYGLRVMFNDAELGNFLSFMHKSFAGTKKWQSFLGARPAMQKAEPIVQAEEFFSWIVEQQRVGTLIDKLDPNRNVIKKILDFIKKSLRKILYFTSGVKSTDMTMEDIDNTILMAVRSIQNRATAPIDSGTESSIIYTKSKNFNIPVNVTKNMPFGWGYVFSNPNKVEHWFSSYNKTVSGVPNTTYMNYTPALRDLAQWDLSVSNQPYPVQEAVKRIAAKYLVHTVPKENGTVRVYFAGKDLGLHKDAKSVSDMVFSGQMSDTITYKDVYEYMVHEGASPKNVSKLMYVNGVAGVRAKYKDKQAYLIYNGDDFLLNTPRYMSEEQPLPKLSYTTENRAATDNFNLSYLGIKKALFSREKWVERLHKVIQTGRSIDDDGNVIKHSAWERFLESAVDPYRRVLVVQRALKEQLGRNAVTHSTNIYKKLSGVSNIMHSKQIDFANEYVTKLTDAMKAMKIPVAELDFINKNSSILDKEDQVFRSKLAVLGDYTRAIHAIERNAELNKRMKNPKAHKSSDYLGGPSGMSDAEAKGIIERYENLEGIKDAADALFEINRQQLDLVEKYHLVPQSVIDKVRGTYKYYVPLKGWSEYVDEFLPSNMYRTRSGFSTGGKNLIKSAKGRNTELPENPVVSSIVQVMDTIAVGEKNEVSKGFLKLVNETEKDSTLWEKADTETDFFRIQSDNKGNLVFRKKQDQLEGKGLDLFKVINDKGQVVRIAIHDKPLHAALTNQNMLHVHPIIDNIRTLTRMISMLNTNYNPTFFLPNGVRDWESALLNLGGVIEDNKKKGLINEGANIRKNITKDMATFKLPRVLWKIIRDKPMESSYEKEVYSYYVDFRKYGGHTRMFEARTFDDAYKELRSNVRKDPTKLMTWAKSSVEYLDNMSDASENSTRLSVYIHVYRAFERTTRATAREEGWSNDKLLEMLEQDKERSANIALEITVNFTRKGTWSPLTNALYAFSSASIGGNARILQNLFRRNTTPKDKAIILGKFMGSGIASAICLSYVNRMLMGDDDDGINKYDKIPQYIKDRNFIIASPFGDGGYIKIPIAYGYNIFNTIGNEIEMMMRGRGNPARSAVTIVTGVFDNFSPIGGSSGGFPAFMPTLIRPIAEVAFNTNFAGTPIYPQTLGFKGEGPDAYKYFMSNPVIYQEIAQMFNAATGGTKTRSGLIDVSPESIQHIMQSYLGGLGKAIIDTVNMGYDGLVNGVPINPYKAPILNRFTGEVSYSDTASIFANAANEVALQDNAVKMAKEDKTMSMEEKISTNRDSRVGASLKPILDSTNRQIADIRKQEKMLTKSHPSKGKVYQDRMKGLEQRKERIMKTFIRAAEKRGLDYDR